MNKRDPATKNIASRYYALRDIFGNDDEISEKQYLEMSGVFSQIVYVQNGKLSIDDIKIESENSVKNEYGEEYNGETALILATINNSIKSVKILAKKEIRMTTPNKRTALMYAAKHNRTELIKYLKREMKMKDINEKTALIHAIYNKHYSCIHLLSCEKLLVDDEGNNALIYVILKNDHVAYEQMQIEFGYWASNYRYNHKIPGRKRMFDTITPVNPVTTMRKKHTQKKIFTHNKKRQRML